jgi:hypothetical protein
MTRLRGGVKASSLWPVRCFSTHPANVNATPSHSAVWCISPERRGTTPRLPRTARRATILHATDDSRTPLLHRTANSTYCPKVEVLPLVLVFGDRNLAGCLRVPSAPVCVSQLVGLLSAGVRLIGWVTLLGQVTVPACSITVNLSTVNPPATGGVQRLGLDHRLVSGRSPCHEAESPCHSQGLIVRVRNCRPPRDRSSRFRRLWPISSSVTIQAFLAARLAPQSGTTRRCPRSGDTDLTG